MGVRFSLVYPTRHRPAFIRQALRFLEKQEYQNFEVIVSDNYVDSELSCENECRSASIESLKYVRPPHPVSMVENWNYALQFASGDYICYFTDKMFLLPHTLSITSDCILKSQPEIVSWVDNSYTAKNFPDYFGEGVYIEAPTSIPSGTEFCAYDPHEELSKKGLAYVSRNEQDKASYARGKICFGAYSLELCNRIAQKTETLFHDICPDYTSMVLALSLAKSAAEIGTPGIVHINTDFSNGGQVAIHDEFALRFLNDSGNPQEILGELLVPGLYCSPHNIVARDYWMLKKKFGLNFQFDLINWLVYITEDLDIPGRQWSSKEVKEQQHRILHSFIANLPATDQHTYRTRLRSRHQKQEELERTQQRMLVQHARANNRKIIVQNVKRIAKAIIKAIVPQIVIKKLSAWLPAPRATKPSNTVPAPSYYRSHLEEILK